MKSPAFRLYPADFWSSPDVQVMDLHEVGAYFSLLCAAWQNERHGYLPDNDNHLRRLARMTPEQWEGSREILLKKFPVVEEGQRANPRMVEEAGKQAEFSAAQREKARKRWRDAPAPAGTAGGDAEIMPDLCRGNAGASISDARAMPSVSVTVSASVTASDTDSGFASSLALTAPAVITPPVIVIPLVSGFHEVTEAEVALWKPAYPAVDVLMELRRLVAWLDANPTRRSAKVAGSKKRITNWLSNSQDRGGRNGGFGNSTYAIDAHGRTGRNLDAAARVLNSISHREGLDVAG